VLKHCLILPHGSEIVPEFGYSGSAVEKLIHAVKYAAEISNSDRPDTIVIATPHNVRVSGHIAVVTSQYTKGTLTEKGRKIGLKLKCNREFALKIVEEAKKRSLPVVGVNFGTDSGATSCIQLDWGSLIPLRFLVKNKRADVILISPSREVEFQILISFGKVIGRMMEKDISRFVFVASADQAHTHSKNGPYGYSKEAQIYDSIVLDAVRSRLSSLEKVRMEIVERAKPDSLWQMLILAGIADELGLNGRLLAYEVPSYYGMLCAIYE